MRGSDAFRHKLRHRLVVIAQMRRRSCANQPSGADLKTIAHCEWLAASADTLSPRLCDAVNETLSDPAAARRFATIWAELPEALGTTIWPRDAAELTTVLLRQAAPDATPSRRARLAQSSPTGSDRCFHDDAPKRLAAAVAGDFTGGLAVVAPMLAVWQVAVGLRQWNQAGFASSHPSTLAHVDSASTSGVGREGVSPHLATVTFMPAPGAGACRVKVELGGAAPTGAMVPVVPRSPICETPLVVSAIGDPAASFAMAAAFAVAGALSLRVWNWLGRTGCRRTSPAHAAGVMHLAL